MTDQRPPQPVRLVPEPCACSCGQEIDTERLRKLREHLMRNVTAVAKALDQIIEEVDQNKRVA